LTRDYPPPLRRILARRVALNSFYPVIASFLIGTHNSAFLWNLHSRRAGRRAALIVISNGWTMLKSKEEMDRGPDVQEKVNPNDVFRSAFYPLTLPLTVGPGSISMAITLGANEPHHLGPNLLAILAAVIGSALVAVSIYLWLRILGPPRRLSLRKRHEHHPAAFLPFFSFASASQILWNGARALLLSLPAGHWSDARANW